ncbi:hypothetical protein SCOR_09385 [Sulfidibacter corallicola]
MLRAGPVCRGPARRPFSKAGNTILARSALFLSRNQAGSPPRLFAALDETNSVKSGDKTRNQNTRMFGEFVKKCRASGPIYRPYDPLTMRGLWLSGFGLGPRGRRCASLFGVTDFRYMRRFVLSAGPANLLPCRPSKHAGTLSMDRFDKFSRRAFRP